MTNIKIDGTDYDLDSLSDEAKAQLASLQAVDRKITDAQETLAILQSAHNAYAQVLSAQLPETTQPGNGVADVVTIDGKNYALADFSDAAKAELMSLQFVTGQISQQQNMLAVLGTARNAYAQALKDQLLARK